MRGDAALPDKPDRADSRKRTEFDMQRRRGERGREDSRGRVDLTVEGARSRGVRAGAGALTAGESLVRNGLTWSEPGAGDGAVRRISGHARSR